MQLGFRWGDVNSNATLLAAGGWVGSGRPHYDDLHRGDDAHVNESVMLQVRRWYVQAGRPDAAGAGLYFCADLCGTSNYGNDLLVLELPTEAAATWGHDPSGGGDLKARADRALADGKFSDLPLVTHYSGAWHVISRAPLWHAGDCCILFRPPSAADVFRVWHQHAYGRPVEAVVDFLACIADVLLGGGRRSRAAEVLLHRLLFDHGHDFLAAVSVNSQAQGVMRGVHSLKKCHASLGRVVQAFQQVIPGHPKTVALAGLL
jgi:hypothetical protein